MGMYGYVWGSKKPRKPYKWGVAGLYGYLIWCAHQSPHCKYKVLIYITLINLVYNYTVRYTVKTKNDPI